MRTRFLSMWFLAVALIGVGWWQGNCDVAHAATAYVTNNLDSGTGSLRWAVDNSANGDTVAIVTPGPINVNSPINIDHNLTIAGPEIAVDPTQNPASVSPAVSGQVAIVSGGSGSVFFISAGNVDMSHLYIAGGVAQGTSQPTGATSGTGNDALGGGIVNTGAGSLSLDYCTLENNNAIGGNGPDGGGNAYGGAIASSGSLTINHSTFKNNNAIAGTGTNSLGNNNHAYGGGVYSTGATTILNSTFTLNVAQGGSSNAKGGFAEGGALSVNSPGSLSITNSTFNGNSAQAASGTNVGGNAYGGAVSATVAFNPLNSTFVGNTAMFGSGVTNGSSVGSGVYYFGPTTLIVNNCIIANNSGATTDLDAHPGFNAFGSPGVNTSSVIINSLAANGGPTETMSSSDTNYVKNVGDFGLASPPISLDQRGWARVGGTAQDAGAMENDGLAPTNTGTPTSTDFTFQLVNGTVNFTAQQFEDSLVYPGAPNQSLQGIVITDVTGGNLMLNGQKVPIGSIISVDDLDNLSFVSDGSGTPGFTWQPSDGTNPLTGITSVNAGEHEPFVPTNSSSPGTEGGDPVITLDPVPVSVYFGGAPTFTVTGYSNVESVPPPPAGQTTPAENKTRQITVTVSDSVLNDGLQTSGGSWSGTITTTDGTPAQVSVPCDPTFKPGIHTITITATNVHHASATRTLQFLVDQIPVISNQSSITSPQSINLGDTFSQELDGADPDYWIPGTTTEYDRLQFRVDQTCYGTGDSCDSSNTASNIGSFNDSDLTGHLPDGTTLTTTFKWKPTQVGKYRLLVTLTDYWGYPSTSFIFTVIVNPPDNNPPVIVNPGTQTANKNTQFSLPIPVSDAENDPLTYSVSGDGLPPGLSLNPTSTGVTISGIPNTTGTYTVILNASDGNHTTPTSASFIINVNDVDAPAIDNILVNGTALSSPVNVAANQNFNGLQATAHVNNFPDNLTFLTYEGTPANPVGSWSVTNTTGSVGTNLTTSTAAFSWLNVPSGVHVVTVRVTALNGKYDERTFTVQAGNAPTLSLSPSGPISVTAGQTVNIDANASDADSPETLTFSKGTTAPAGLTFVGQTTFNSNTATGHLSWTPGATDVGSYTFDVIVTDAAGLQGVATITVNVDPAPPNLPPTVQNPGPQTVNVGEDAHIQIVANDPEGAQLTYTSTTLPGWASLDSQTGLITHAPGVGDVGGPTNVTINVSDGVNTVSTTFALTVVQVANQPPVVSNPGTWMASAGTYATFSIFATDPESGPLTYTPSANMPTWVHFQAPTAAGVILEGTPQAGDVGITNVTVDVSDGVNTVPVSFEIDVVASGVPTLQATPNAPANPEQLKLGEGYSKIFLATDSDYPETLTFSAVVTDMADNSIVNGASFLPMYESGSSTMGTARAEAFQWTPSAAGTYKVVITVTDGEGNATSLTFSIHVSSPPKIQVNGTTSSVTLSATPQLPLTVPVAVSDPDDHESLAVTLDSNAPAGMTVKSPSTFSNVPGNTPEFTELDFTPSISQAFQSFTFNVTVTDSAGLTAQQQVTVNVGAVNAAPVITSPTSGSTVNVVTGHNVSLPVVATDAENDTLTYGATGLPAGLSIDSSTGVISGTVTAASGSNTVTATVDDGYHVSPAASVTFKIVVGGTNHDPSLNPIADQTLTYGQTLNVQAVGSDPDNDSLTYSMSGSNLPAWLHLDPSTGLITGNPVSGDEGTWNVTVTVNDGYGGTASQSFVLTVNGPFSASSTNANGYTTIVYTVTNTTGAAISPVVRGNLTGAGYTNNANALFYASQGIESDQWASPKIQRDLDPTKSTRIITWNVGSLAPGASATLTIYVPVNNNIPSGTQLTNQWTVDYGATELTAAPVTSN